MAIKSHIHCHIMPRLHVYWLLWLLAFYGHLWTYLSGMCVVAHRLLKVLRWGHVLNYIKNVNQNTHQSFSLSRKIMLHSCYQCYYNERYRSLEACGEHKRTRQKGTFLLIPGSLLLIPRSIPRSLAITISWASVRMYFLLIFYSDNLYHE